MRWFIPNGIATPAYAPAGRVSVVAGVDGLPGHVINGIYTDGDWQKTAQGFYLLNDRQDANDCLRLHLPPNTVEIEHQGRTWCVAHLLTRRASGWESALPRIYTPDGWADPYHAAPAQQRLRAIMQAAQDGTPPPENAIAEIIGLMVEMTYHLSLTELAHARWMDEELAAKWIEAATGAENG